MTAGRVPATREALPLRAGWSQLELVVALLVLLLICAIGLPLVQSGREASRRHTCQDRLRTLTLALHSYHDTYAALPPAAVWSTAATQSLALHSSQRVELITHENWALLLLPYLDEGPLAEAYAWGRPIGDRRQESIRTTRLAAMACPTDAFNRDDNRHVFRSGSGDDNPIEFARGSYAINGGTHDLQRDAPSTAFPKGDHLHLLMQDEPRRYELRGNGIAGFNRSFSIREFANGQSTLIALDEIRAGIHPLDPRGVWALGQIGGSVTWAHGVGGDAYAPNHQWPRADDVMGCRALHAAVGSDVLTREQMPCVDYVDINQQATARSLHPAGVHAGFLDGSVRFIGDGVDPGLWHVMHSRETPESILAGRLEKWLPPAASVPEPPSAEQTETASSPLQAHGAGAPKETLANSIGMEFVLIPAGEFVMGMPDRGNNHAPPECPPHRVRISRAFFLGRCEVTRGEYSRIMGQTTGDLHPAVDSDPQSDQFPVTGITWDEAARFCERLTALEAEQDAGRRYRLPTEAEWEYACRSGSSEPYDWSPQRRPGDQTGEAAGILPPLPLASVGSYPANRFGLHDMRGNAWEWTADWFERDYYLHSPMIDPPGPADGFLKVVRGGDWRFVGEPCQIDYSMLPPWKGNSFVGFRVACEVSDR